MEPFQESSPETMEKSKKLDVLKAFNRFLWLLRAYNTENFSHVNKFRFVKNAAYAIFVTLFIGLIPTLIVLGIWCLIDENANKYEIVVATPLLLTILQLFIKMATLIMNNRAVFETRERLQAIIDQRKWFGILFTRGVNRNSVIVFF